MKSLWVVLLFWSMTGPILAQKITVRDAENNTPIERATITNLNNMNYATTNDQGVAQIEISSDTTLLEVRCMGYRALILTRAEIKEMDFEIMLQPATLSLDQVVVSATRWNQSSRELPFKITSLSAKDVQFQNPQTSADLLEQTGQVFMQKSQQGGGSPMIRGFATNRLLIAIDGIRMNNAIFRSGNLQNVISLDPFAIERTEVYFGPGSVIYGSDAIGGVMSFSTLQPQLSATSEAEFSGHAATRYSSANQEFTKHFDLNVGWEKWALRTSISHFDFGDVQMGKHGPDEYLKTFRVQRIDSTDQVVPNENPAVQKPTAYQQTNLMQKVRFKPNTHWDFTYAFHYSETSDYPRYDRLVRLKNGRPRSAEWYYGPQVWQMNNLTVSHSKAGGLYDKATLRLAYQRYEESRNDRDFNVPLLNQRKEEVWAYSSNIDFLKRISVRHKIFYGAEAVYNDVSSRGSTKNINTNQVSRAADRYPQSNWQSYALYLNHEWEVSPKFTTQAGGRYNQFMLNADFSDNLEFYPLPVAEANLNKGALTGSLGFVYRPDDSWKLRLNFGTAFRSPNVDDIGKVFDSGDRVVVVPNSDLNAEYAYNTELGLAKIFGDKFKVDFTAYYTYLDDAMVRRPFVLNGLDSLVYDGELSEVQAIQNAARSTVYGVQVGFDWQLSSHLRLVSSFNYQKGQEEMDDGTTTPSRHAAPWFGITRLEYEHKQVRMQLYSQYSGEVSYANLNFEERTKPFIYAVNSQGQPYSPGWYTLNFKASYAFSKTFSLTAGMENITDQRYRPYSSGLVAPGRNVILALNANF